jgi:hypothetical protein
VVIRVHYNRGSARSGLPWSIHTSKSCHQAEHVIFRVRAETEECPSRRSNPKYFIRCNGTLHWEGKTAVVQ